MQLCFPSPYSLKAVSCGVAAALLMGFASAHGQSPSYITNFDNPNIFPDNSSIDGDDGWTGTDTVYQPDVVTDGSGFTLNQIVPGDQCVVVGGRLGGPLDNQTTAYVSHSFAPVSTLANPGYSFNVDFGISSSNNSFPADNQFGFTFQNALLGNVFSINFVPETSGTTNGVPNANNYDAVTYTTYTAPGVNATQHPFLNGVGTPQAIALNSRYHLALAVNPTNGAFSITLTLENSSTGALLTDPADSMTFTGTLGGTNGAGVSDLAATYIQGASGSNGSNALFFDNFAAVPEPSTYAMLGLGLAGLALRFRRKARA